MNNSNNFFNKVKNSTKVSEVIKQYINIEKAGNNFKAICPFHGDKNPSLVISDDKGIYKCFSCNNSGDMFSFVSNYKKINRFQAAKEIIDVLSLNIELPNNYIEKNEYYQKLELHYKLNEKIRLWYAHFLQNKENNFAINYLYSRGLNDEDIKYFKIGYAPSNNILFELINQNYKTLVQENELFKLEKLIDNSFLNVSEDGNYYDFFSNRIMFSIYNKDDNCVGFSGRSLDKQSFAKYLNTKTTEVFKKESILYNFNNVLKNSNNIDTLFILEGFMDVIKTHKSGIINCVATMGVELSLLHLEHIKNSGFKNLVFCFDNDLAGLNATIKLINSLSSNNDFKIFIVEHKKNNYKDIDEYANIYGYEETKKLMNNHIHSSEYLLKYLVKNNELTKSQLSSLFDNAINIIKKHGRLEFYDFYKNFLINNFNIEESIVKTKIHDAINEKKITNKINFIKENNSDNEYSNSSLNNSDKDILKSNKSQETGFESFYKKQNLMIFISIIKKMFIINPHDSLNLFYDYASFLDQRQNIIMNLLIEFYEISNKKQKIFFDNTYKNNDFELFLISKKGSFINAANFLMELYKQHDIYESNSNLMRLEIDWMNLKLLVLQKNLLDLQKGIFKSEILDKKEHYQKIDNVKKNIKETEEEINNLKNATKWLKKDELK